MTAREAAKDFIRGYVLRGETIMQLAAGMLGSFGGEYDAQIGGYMFNNFQKPDQISRKIGRYQIGVSEVNGIECLEIFSLHEIYNEILKEKQLGKQEQLTLF
jgi:hypothetical protein